MFFHQQNHPRILKQRAKHPIKIHIWGGISKREATNVIIFSGIMNAEYLAEIFQFGLLPFLRDRYPDGHRLQQDNDPKHASYLIEEFFKEHNVNWWTTPPESPDLNPIENLWGSLKTYKPKNLEELKEGIQQFWVTLTPEVCTRYIDHLKKVIPKVIQEEVLVDINKLQVLSLHKLCNITILCFQIMVKVLQFILSLQRIFATKYVCR